MMVTVTAAMMTMTMVVVVAVAAVVVVVEVVAGVQRQLPTAWCGAGIRRPEAAEMGIKRKREQCGYDRWKFVFSKIVTRVYFLCTLQLIPNFFLTA